MKLDLNRVLDCEGDAAVVTADVDLCEFEYRGVSPFKEPAKLDVKAENRTGVVTLNLTYGYRLNLVCDRCLTPYTTEVSQRQTHTVVRTLNCSDDDDYVVTPDGIVELTELATNDIILSLPGKFLCREDCKGLCPQCGCDFNSSSCGCVTKQLDSRFDVLDGLFDNDNN